jgi:hypothetical protein
MLLQSFLCIGSADRLRRSSTIHAEVFSGGRIPSDDKMFHGVSTALSVTRDVFRFRWSRIWNVSTARGRTRKTIAVVVIEGLLCFQGWFVRVESGTADDPIAL